MNNLLRSGTQQNFKNVGLPFRKLPDAPTNKVLLFGVVIRQPKRMNLTEPY
jgi:hypothetical protein